MEMDAARALVVRLVREGDEIKQAKLLGELFTFFDEVDARLDRNHKEIEKRRKDVLAQKLETKKK